MRQSGPVILSAPNVASMRSIGTALADALDAIKSPFVIALEGELGAGKTTLVGAVLNHLGFTGSVKSPTYTLMETYALACRDAYHLDLYRLTDPREVDALGLRDLLVEKALFLIEWPERGAGELPPVDLKIQIVYADQGGRQLVLTGLTTAGAQALLAIEPTAKP